MIQIKGKYNSANVMIDEIDETTREQIQNFLNHPAFRNGYIAIMPDCHAGIGSVIGFTMPLNEYVIPNVIGVDIGCGMMSTKFNTKELKEKEFDSFVKDNIPAGFSINENTPILQWMDDDVYKICDKINFSKNKACKSIGSLGGGNHFIEAGYDKDGFLNVTVHSGSRGFGNKTAQYHQDIAKENLKKYFIHDQYKNLEFLLINEGGKEYLKDLNTAQLYADMNRSEIMFRIKKFLGVSVIQTKESVHNFIGHDKIIRKGATQAYEGQDVIIPFNMRDGIAICKGRGCKKYNYSAPHGAGRILSRTQAKRDLSVEDFQKKMRDANVYTTTANESTLDESPDAYKDFNTILENIKETVKVVDLIKPVYNFKAGD